MSKQLEDRVVDALRSYCATAPGTDAMNAAPQVLALVLAVVAETRRDATLGAAAWLKSAAEVGNYSSEWSNAFRYAAGFFEGGAHDRYAFDVMDPKDRPQPAKPAVPPVPAPRNDPPTHRCKVCGALWWRGNIPPVGMSWSLRSEKAGPCCDNVQMGEQIEKLPCYCDTCLTYGGRTE